MHYIFCVCYTVVDLDFYWYILIDLIYSTINAFGNRGYKVWLGID